MATSKLKAKPPTEVIPKKPKFMIYGAAKVGKTWASLDFPDVYYIDTEGGATREHYQKKLKQAKGMYLGVAEGSQSFQEVLEQIKALATEKHHYKTLVIDSFTYLYNLELAKEVERLGDKDAFGASKKPAIQKSRQLLMWLDKLDMNVILVCHEKAKWTNQEQVGMTFDGYEKLDYMLELTLYIRKQGNTRTALIKESRMEEFPMGESFPWSYVEFASRYGKDVMEAEAKPITLATSEQLTELATLLENWKAPEGWADKTLTAAKAEAWGDMSTEQIGKVIGFIQSKLTTKAG